MGFAAGGGPLPDANLGATIRGSLLLRRWQFDVAYHHWLPSVAVADDAPAVGADIALYSAVVRACPRWDLGPVELGACGGLDVGLLRVEPVGLDRGRIARSVWTAVSAGGTFAWPFAREAALTVRAEAVVPFARPEFEIRFAGLVHSVAPAGGRGIVGIEVRFP